MGDGGLDGKTNGPFQVGTGLPNDGLGGMFRPKRHTRRYAPKVIRRQPTMQVRNKNDENGMPDGQPFAFRDKSNVAQPAEQTDEKTRTTGQRKIGRTET